MSSSGKTGLNIAMRLNPADSLARDVWARLLREDINASSLSGFTFRKGDWVEGYDNSLDADPDDAGEKIDIFECYRSGFD